LAVVTAGLILASGLFVGAAIEYPLTLVAKAEAKNETTTLTSTVTLRLERPMRATDLRRTTDGFKYNGYAGFLNALRQAPAIGSIQAGSRKVDIRYARDEATEQGHRLVLVADRPLYFLAGGATEPKERAGYELTVVELQLDAQNAGTGRMAAAARVTPSGDGGVVLDDYAEAPVQLTIGAAR